jgi:hypothetical protein
VPAAVTTFDRIWAAKDKRGDRCVGTSFDQETFKDIGVGAVKRPFGLDVDTNLCSGTDLEKLSLLAGHLDDELMFGFPILQDAGFSPFFGLALRIEWLNLDDLALVCQQAQLANGPFARRLAW